VAIVGNDFTLSYSGVATEAGRKGDPVRVRFPTSGKVLVATVSGPGKVMIED
ncbi:MAG: Chaperone for flagella basal body P-ring formation, partial [Pseudomonadota bacterium]